MLIPVLVLVVLFLILPPKWATLLALVLGFVMYEQGSKNAYSDGRPDYRDTLNFIRQNGRFPNASDEERFHRQNAMVALQARDFERTGNRKDQDIHMRKAMFPEHLFKKIRKVFGKIEQILMKYIDTNLDLPERGRSLRHFYDVYEPYLKAAVEHKFTTLYKKSMQDGLGFCEYVRNEVKKENVPSSLHFLLEMCAAGGERASKRLRFTDTGDAASINAMGRTRTGRGLYKIDKEKVKRIRQRHKHAQGETLRNLYDIAKVDNAMDNISHMFIQADKSESIKEDKPIASRALEIPFEKKRRDSLWKRDIAYRSPPV